MTDVEGDFAGLSLEDVEEEEVVRLEASVSVGGESLVNYFVGMFLTSSVVNFLSMRATLANVWHPIAGSLSRIFLMADFCFDCITRLMPIVLNQVARGTLTHIF